MIFAPLELKAFEYTRRLEGGWSRPLLVTAEDENGSEFKVVVKTKKPDQRSTGSHFGATSLACELICSMLARHLDLQVPDYAVVEIKRDFAESVWNDEVRALLLQNLGRNFGTIFHLGATTWFPHKYFDNSFTQMNLIEDILTFDSTVINGDRSVDKPNILQVGAKQLLIDHSLALPVCRWSDKQITESPLFPEKNVKSHCSYKALQKIKESAPNFLVFTKLLQNWENIISQKEWSQLRSYIPSSWEEHPGDLDKIFNFLQNRSFKFEEISNSLRSFVL